MNLISSFLLGAHLIPSFVVALTSCPPSLRFMGMAMLFGVRLVVTGAASGFWNGIWESYGRSVVCEICCGLPFTIALLCWYVAKRDSESWCVATCEIMHDKLLEERRDSKRRSTA